MRLLWEVARRSFRRWSTYRLATAAGVFTNTVFGYLRAYIYIAVAAVGGGTASGWTQQELITFAFATQALLACTGAFGDSELADRVRSGDVVVDFYRPVDLQAWWLAAWMGKSSFLLLARGIPPILLGAIVFDLDFPHSIGMWLVVLLSLVLASAIGFTLRFLIWLTTFWLLDNRGLDQLVTLTLTFFGGLLLPITMFPHTLQIVAKLLPFAAMAQLPAELFIGIHEGATEILLVLGTQVFWLVALGLAGRLLLQVATRKVVIQGG